MARSILTDEERQARHHARLKVQYAEMKEIRAFKALEEGRPVGKSGPAKQFTAEEIKGRQREAMRLYREEHRAEIAAKRSEQGKAARALVALVEGREPGRVGQPQKIKTSEEIAARKRMLADKARAYREGNLEKAREYGREWMRRDGAAKALAAGREPGKKGKPRVTTDAEIQARRTARTKEYYYANLDASRERAAKKERDRRAAKKDGTWVPRQKLTDDDRRLRQVLMAQKRRARLANAFVENVTAYDYQLLHARQNGLCNIATCDTRLTEENRTLDHVMPLALGGKHEMDNFQLLCGPCNFAKGARHPSGFVFRTELRCE